MYISSLIAAFLLAVTFTLATQLSLWREQADDAKAQPTSVMEILMGDSRRLFANHFVTKADVYLHRGVYPSIFDQAQREDESHLAQEAQAPHPGDDHAEPNADELIVTGLLEATEPGTQNEHHDRDHDQHGEPDEHSSFLGKPRDWIDAFGRNFYPTMHGHLDGKNEQREILPWLRLAADLNPNQVDIYPLGAYWLRQRMGKVDEAEAFLREGWRSNPDSYEILFELGRLQEENRKDSVRARNLFEAALRRWTQSEAGKEDRDEFAYMQITGHLARLEERDNKLDKAISYLELLHTVSPSPESIQRQIDDLKHRMHGASTE